MNKKLLLFCLSVVSVSLMSTATLQAASHCTGLDIAFGGITLTGVGNGKITYDITISNKGTQTIIFNKLTVKNYTSTDGSYVVADVNGGSALFSTLTSQTSLSAGQDKVATFHANYSGDIKTLPYLIIQLEYQDTECDADNNRTVLCTLPNPVLNSVELISVGPTEGTYNAYIQNTGGDTLFLSKTIIQNYVSTNDISDGEDAAAGGSVLNYGAKQYLLANESYVVESFSFNAINLSDYSYVIVNLYYTTTTCNNGTGTIAQELVVTGIENEESITGNPVIWDMSSHSFVTKDQNSIKWSGALSYKLFDVSGKLQATGTTSPGERVYVPEGSGLGILIISDEQQNYSQKIMR